MAPALALAGCASFGKSSPFWGTIAAGFSGNGKPAVTREYAQSLPYASMFAWFKGAPPALIVLAEFAPDGRWIWASADRQSIITFGPFVTGMIGFELELRGVQLAGKWQRSPLALVGQELGRVLDVVAEGDRVNVAMTSRFSLGKTEVVEIFGQDKRLQIVDERVRADGRTRFYNRYWVDAADGRCWKSRQTPIPTLPEFNIEVVKFPNA